MLKFVLFLLVVFLVISAWGIIKRRLKLAFKVAAVVYAISFLIRLARIGIDEQRATELGIVTAAFVAFWVLAWGATTLIARWRGNRVATPQSLTAYLMGRFKPR